MGFKNAILTAGIGVLGTIAVNGLKPLNIAIDNLTAASQPVGVVAYAAPVAQGAADWWWWQAVWWIPLCMAVAITVVSVRNQWKYPSHRKLSVAEAKRDEGVYAAEAKVRNAQAGKLLAAVEAKYETEQPAIEMEPPAKKVSIDEGMRQLARTVIPLGYTAKGEVVTWDVTQAPHIRVHGKTQGSGKTNLIKSIAASALRLGHRVIVLDRRGFKDWQDFRDHAELIDNRKPGVFASVTGQVKAIYQRRDSVLGQHGAGNIEELPKPFRRVFLIIAEFGTACRSATDEELEIAVKNLKTIMSEAGATGVHLIYEAQVVNHDWPRELRGNSDPVCGYLPEDTAKAGGYSYAHELKPYQFHHDGQTFTTWNMKEHARTQLNLAKLPDKKLIDERSKIVTEERSGNGQGTPLQEGNAGNVPVPNVENSLKNIYLRERSWEKVAEKYFADHPQSEHADWCKAMAEIANDGRPYTDFKGRLSLNLFNQFSPKGKMRIVA